MPRSLNENTEPSSARTLPEPFVYAILSAQDVIYAYLMTLTGNPSDAEEVLQETNLRLCRQSEELPNIRDFRAWACRIAYFEVLSHRKRRVRDRHTFDDELLESVAKTAAGRAEDFERRQAVLEECLEKLPSRHRKMIQNRYSPGGSVRQLAEETGRTPASVSQTLYRLRSALLRCIQSALATR